MRRVHVEYLGDSIELPPGETVVGRDIGCALRFNDPAVSRRHLRFIRRAHEVFIEDLGSSNGTLVNGRKVTAPISLGEGDTISVGGRVLTMRIFDAEDEDDAATLLLRDFSFGDSQPVVQTMPRAMTQPMAAVTLPPGFANQKCPQCAGPVSELDESCGQCGFEWGSFRPTNPTHPRSEPIRKRRHDRHPIELHLVYTSSELEIEAITADLSESGVFVCSQVLEPVGTDCWLTILVDGGPPLRVRGTVRRVVERDEQMAGENIGLGVEFIDIGHSELSWIRAQLARSADI